MKVSTMWFLYSFSSLNAENIHFQFLLFAVTFETAFLSFTLLAISFDPPDQVGFGNDHSLSCMHASPLKPLYPEDVFSALPHIRVSLDLTWHVRWQTFTLLYRQKTTDSSPPIRPITSDLKTWKEDVFAISQRPSRSNRSVPVSPAQNGWRQSTKRLGAVLNSAILFFFWRGDYTARSSDPLPPADDNVLFPPPALKFGPIDSSPPAPLPHISAFNSQIISFPYTALIVLYPPSPQSSNFFTSNKLEGVFKKYDLNTGTISISSHRDTQKKNLFPLYGFD